MATFKHISSKNADYGAAEQYLTFEHDEFTMKPTLDEAGRLVPRENYRIATLNCGEEEFAVACMRSNLRYGKNQKREDVKSHHYIISFDPRDGPDNGLTIDRAQALGEEFCAEHFPGHQANALMEQEISVRMTNFSAILNDLTASFEGRNEYIERLCRFPLLILDDFGMERGTEYGLEQVYNVIDSRYRSRKPLIVTTTQKRTASAARFLIIPYNNAIYVYSSPCSTPRRRSRPGQKLFSRMMSPSASTYFSDLCTTKASASMGILRSCIWRILQI